MIKFTTFIGLMTCSWAALGGNSIYCPQNHAYINVGMTQDQVISACGEPSMKQESNQPVTQKVQVKQLIYNSQGGSQTFYGAWALPIGNGNTIDNLNFRDKSKVGANLQVNIVNEKVASVNVNGENSNAFSICKNQSIEIGDPMSKVYMACGSPTMVNQTYIEQAIPSSTKPQLWRYEIPYQPSISLTFVDGKLQSIN